MSLFLTYLNEEGNKMSATTSIELEKRIKSLADQVRSLDLYTIMELEMQGQADFIVNETMKECREYAEKMVKKHQLDYSTSYRECIHHNIQDVVKELYEHYEKVVSAVETLFTNYFNNNEFLEMREKFYPKAQEIIHNALVRLLLNS